MKNKAPLVSVIIPCYNVSSYVEKAIRSILDQTYDNTEIWIIDDASTDDTLQKIKAVKDDRIKVIEFKTNTQKVRAVNEVLQKVNGEYICFQDADDWSEPQRIQLQVKEFINDPELGVCFTGYRYAGEKSDSPSKIAISNDELRDEFLQFGHKENSDFDATICGTMMISGKALQNTTGYHPFFAGRVAEDIHWVYRILKKFKGITVDKILYNYTVRKGSFTDLQFAGKNPKYAYSWQLLSEIIYKDIHENIDLLAPPNREALAQIELKACEEKLSGIIQQLNETKMIYEKSSSFRLGRLILSPFRLVKSLFKGKDEIKNC